MGPAYQTKKSQFLWGFFKADLKGRRLGAETALAGPSMPNFKAASIGPLAWTATIYALRCAGKSRNLTVFHVQFVIGAFRSLAVSRRDAPELCMNRSPRIQEGAGKAGCPMHPQPRVQS
jgi:hypothetical protein